MLLVRVTLFKKVHRIVCIFMLKKGLVAVCIDSAVIVIKVYINTI